MAGLAAYANEHINSAARDVATYFAVQGPGPVAELAASPPARQCAVWLVYPGARRSWRAPHRDWSCSNRSKSDSVVKESLASHGAGGELFNGRGELSRLDAEKAGHRNARQQVEQVMTAD